ncbi:L-type lectin-domain containing receptor kinase SIT2-like [Phragmites australis]|uniref:L-type lectin-domain containing receptor kinase SIT2-like n=1 Tax=Phragmites australis TaxID=29695 RepID=UPI002D7679FE|nr:L-type lectin-domain containing receptor kinase SIT2-like [Phragmites australis]
MPSMHHYVLGWSFDVGGPTPDIDMAKQLKLASKSSKSWFKTLVIALPVVFGVLTLTMVACVILLMRRRFMNRSSLGTGGFGRVYKGVLPTSSMEVAVKMVSHESRQGMKEFVAEVASIGRLSHCNLVQLLGCCRLKDELLLVYDYMPNDSLEKYLYGHDDKPALNWAQRFHIIKGVASCLPSRGMGESCGTSRCQSKKRVLLDGEMNGHLGDFGLASTTTEIVICTVSSVPIMIKPILMKYQYRFITFHTQLTIEPS